MIIALKLSCEFLPSFTFFIIDNIYIYIYIYICVCVCVKKILSQVTEKYLNIGDIRNVPKPYAYHFLC